MYSAYSPVLVAIAVYELLFLSATAVSISSSCSNKDGACPESSIPSKLTSTCFPRYISDSYFTKNSSLIDSDFKDFIYHELNLASSQSSMRVSYLHHDLIGEGSHRHLCSSIGFSIQPEFATFLSTSICEVVILERLPSGVFTDPFELEHLIHRGVFKDAAVFGDTNLEFPSFVSNQSVVEIHMPAAIDFSTAQKNALELKIEIPVHARYQVHTAAFALPSFLRREVKSLYGSSLQSHLVLYPRSTHCLLRQLLIQNLQRLKRLRPRMLLLQRKLLLRR